MRSGGDRGWSLKNVTVKRRGSTNQKENPEDEPLTTRNGNSCELGCSLAGWSQTLEGAPGGEWPLPFHGNKREGGRMRAEALLTSKDGKAFSVNQSI